MKMKDRHVHQWIDGRRKGPGPNEPWRPDWKVLGSWLFALVVGSLAGLGLIRLSEMLYRVLA